MMSEIAFKSAVFRQLEIFLKGGSTTANEKVLLPDQKVALQYCLEKKVCYLQKPGPGAKDENDIAGRYKLNAANTFEATRLQGLFGTEINQHFVRAKKNG